MKNKIVNVKPVETKTPADGLKVNVLKKLEQEKKVKPKDVFGKSYKGK
jgi:hypothetical protein